MALIKLIPPDRIRQALANGVADFLSANHPVSNDLKQSSLWLHVYTIGSNQILQGLQEAQVAGWRCLATNSASAADVIESDQGVARMTTLLRDPVISEIVQATFEIESLQEVQQQHYELRWLRSPGLLFEAFWLKSDNDQGDLVVPVLFRTDQLQKMKAYRIEDFVNSVRQLISEYYNFDQILA